MAIKGGLPWKQCTHVPTAFQPLHLLSSLSNDSMIGGTKQAFVLSPRVSFQLHLKYDSLLLCMFTQSNSYGVQWDLVMNNWT